MTEAALEERRPMNQDNQVNDPPPISEADRSYALEQGWVPKEQYRGPPEDWIDMPEFARRAREINPILRRNNQRLESDLGAVRQQLQAAQDAIKEQTESIEALKEMGAEQAKEAAARALAKLKSDLREAREANDVDREVEILRNIGIQDDIIRKPAEPPVKKDPPPPQIDPSVQRFREQNTWFDNDPRKRALFVAEMAELAKAGKLEGLSGDQRLALAAENVDKYLGEVSGSRRNGSSRVASGAGGGSRETNQKTYADLPAADREACDRFAKRLVGPNRAWKTIDDYRAHYVKQYQWD